MKVFKLYWKILRKYVPSIIMYFVIFTSIALAMSFMQINDRGDKAFENTKTSIAFIDEDNTALSQNLKKGIEDIANIVKVENTEEKLKDALFFRNINATVRVEKGFSQRLLAGENVSIEMNTIPNTYSSIYVNNLLNNYISTAQSYINHTDVNEAELIEYLEQDLGQSVTTEFTQKQTTTAVKDASTYFNFIPYLLFITLILAISTTMSVINSKNLKRRIQCSPIEYKRMNLELTLGHICIGTIILAAAVGIWFIVQPTILQTPNVFWLIINTICLMLVVMSTGFLVGSLIKSKSAQNVATNVISLGLCFISGVFVPQEFLAGVVLKIANFSPVFWYIKANTLIANSSAFPMETIKPILGYMGIELGFAITIWLITLVINKNRRTSEE